MKYLVAAAALVAMAASPAYAKGKAGCAGDGPAAMYKKMTSMPQDPKLFMLNKVWWEMNSAMSKGNLRGCNKAMMRAKGMI